MNFAIYDSTGRIHNICSAPDTQGFEYFTARGLHFIECDAAARDTTHHVMDGAVVAMPPRPTADHEFCYEAKAWLDKRDIEQLRLARWSVIKEARAAAEFGGFDHEGHRYDSSPASVQRIGTAAQAAGVALAAGMPFSRTWTTSSNTQVDLDAPAMIRLFAGLDAHVSASHARAAALRQQINTATTKKDLEAITW